MLWAQIFCFPLIKVYKHTWQSFSEQDVASGVKQLPVNRSLNTGQLIEQQIVQPVHLCHHLAGRAVAPFACNALKIVPDLIRRIKAYVGGGAAAGFFDAGEVFTLRYVPVYFFIPTGEIFFARRSVPRSLIRMVAHENTSERINISNSSASQPKETKSYCENDEIFCLISTPKKPVPAEWVLKNSFWNLCG